MLSAAGITFSGCAGGTAEIEADATRVGRVELDAVCP
ncbi:hypothetical protein ACUXKL_000875 [Kocuria marina]